MHIRIRTIEWIYWQHSGLWLTRRSSSNQFPPVTQAEDSHISYWPTVSHLIAFLMLRIHVCYKVFICERRKWSHRSRIKWTFNFSCVRTPIFPNLFLVRLLWHGQIGIEYSKTSHKVVVRFRASVLRCFFRLHSLVCPCTMLSAISSSTMYYISNAIRTRMWISQWKKMRLCLLFSIWQSQAVQYM